MKSSRACYEKKIETMDDVIKILNRSKKQVTHLKSRFFYRGQANSDWMITSKFYRDYGDYFKVPSITFEDLIKYFNTEIDNSSYINFHDDLIKRFISHIKNETSFDLDLNSYVALGQHYDLPTNFIDFTYSMETALFFCFYKDENVKNTHYAALYRTNSSLYTNRVINNIVNKNSYPNEQAIEMEKLYSTFTFGHPIACIPHIQEESLFMNIRMQKQQGTLFYNPYPIPYDLIMHRIKETMDGQFETRFLINRDLRLDILQYLEKLDISEDTICPNKSQDSLLSVFKNCSQKTIEEVKFKK